MNRCFCIKDYIEDSTVCFYKGDIYYYEEYVENVENVPITKRRKYNVVQMKGVQDALFFDTKIQETYDLLILFDDYFITMKEHRENKLKNLVDGQ